MYYYRGYVTTNYEYLVAVLRLIEYDNLAAFVHPPRETKIVIISIYKRKQNLYNKLQSARDDLFQELTRMATTSHLWILAILLSFGQHVAAICEGNGWTTLNEAISTKCYHFGGKDKTFDKSETKCESKGGILVRIESAAENDMLWEHIASLGGGNRWIGYTYDHDVGYASWIGEPGEEATYTNFAPGEPNDHTGSENCVQMLQSNGLWNDVECRKTTLKICQKPQTSGGGSWTPWEEWGECSVSCGDGEQIYKRICEGGDDCIGPDEKTEPCNLRDCPGEWTNWEEWGDCSVTCGPGELTYKRQCEGGDDCVGPDEKTEPCNLSDCPGEWTNWEEWGDCSVTCGPGELTYKRQCEGGDDCVGPDEKTEPCNLRDCPGEWTNWEEWGDCSVTCGPGELTYKRQCEGGDDCVGPNEKTEPCNLEDCPGEWTNWEEWGDCSVTCGPGELTYKRQCEGGDDCVGLDEKTEPCNLEDCPGEWTNWEEWGDCSVTCGPGELTYKRQCEGGDDCVGPDEKTEPCNLRDCPGEWTNWEEWGDCSVTCGPGELTYKRQCEGGDDCVGPDENTEPCNLGDCPGALCGGNGWTTLNEAISTKCYHFDGKDKTFDKSETKCESKGGILVRIESAAENDMLWEHIASLGGGNRWIGYTYDHDVGYASWIGEPGEEATYTNFAPGEPNDHTGSENCVQMLQSNGLWNDVECRKTTLKICQKPQTSGGGSWTPWEEWGECSVTCGDGEQIYKRICEGGDDCIGPDEKTEPCNLGDCPGEWTNWEEWGDCSVTCGPGELTYKRQCEGGDDCVGPDEKTETCNLGDCPGDEGWSTWTAWSDCSQSCDDGYMTYHRICLGGNCNGAEEKTEPCNKGECPVDGGWTPWTQGDCSTTCGPGTRFLNRTCTNPTPANDGAECEGADQRVDPCNLGPCPDHTCDCPDNTECVQQGDGTFICRCLPGYIGDCDLCVDIDECETGLHDCTGNTVCVNTIGSYECDCADGFSFHHHRCVDVNECENGEADCPDHSLCVNTYGGYDCICCHGYEEDGAGNCEATGATTPGGKCCVCAGNRCKQEGEVCGDDGHTYDSLAALIIEECLRDDKIHVEYDGSCLNSCANVNCPMHKECKDQDGTPRCVCRECSDSDRQEGPICSSAYQEYDNKCHFYTRMCQTHTEQTMFEDTSPCDNSDKLVGEWSEWSECSVTCGKGEKQRTREATRELLGDEIEKYRLTATAVCYEDPCPGGPCDGYVCDPEAAECVVVDGNAECECPDCSGLTKDPVCGLIGNLLTTFKNFCRLQRRACKTNSTFELVYEGPCTDHPIHCTLLPKYEFVSNDEGCVSKRKQHLHQCAGGCGDNPFDCCQPTTYEIRVFRVWCPWGDSKDHEEADPVDCDCMPGIPQPQPEPVM
ncbi:hypothetical protein ScPMuIL_012147 [Solemya velum]